MSDLPDKIETEFQTNEGFTYDRTEAEIMQDLIDGFNDLIDYIQEVESRIVHDDQR